MNPEHQTPRTLPPDLRAMRYAPPTSPRDRIWWAIETGLAVAGGLGVCYFAYGLLMFVFQGTCNP